MCDCVTAGTQDDEGGTMLQCTVARTVLDICKYSLPEPTPPYPRQRTKPSCATLHASPVHSGQAGVRACIQHTSPTTGGMAATYNRVRTLFRQYEELAIRRTSDAVVR